MNQQMWLVAKNVYRNRIKTAGFWALVIVPLLVPIIALLIGWMVGSSQTTTKLAVVRAPALAQVLGKSKTLDVKTSEVKNKAQARTKLEAGKIDGFLSVADGKYTLTATSKTSGKFDQSLLQSALTEIAISDRSTKLGLTQSELTNLLSPASLATATISTSGHVVNDAEQGANQAIAIVTALIVMLFCSLYVGVTAQEISNEKSNRIMEILLAATSSTTQYYGKIIGVMLLALTQIAIYITGFGAAFVFFKNNSFVVSLTSMFGGEVDLSFLFYALGMVIFAIIGYVFIAAIVASLINDQSQVQQATSPIMYISLIGYLGAIVSAANPSNLPLKILSFIPFISPTLMSSRYAIQISSTQEALAALVLQGLAVIFLAKFGERIYARNVLSYSNERILKQLVANLRGNSKWTPKSKLSENKNFWTRKIGGRLPVWRLVIAGLIVIGVVIYQLVIHK